MKSLIISTIILISTTLLAQTPVERNKTSSGSKLSYTSITVTAGMPQISTSKEGEDSFVMVSGYEGELLITYVESPNLLTCELAKKVIIPNEKVTLYGRFKDDKLFVFDKIEVKTLKIKLTK